MKDWHALTATGKKFGTKLISKRGSDKWLGVQWLVRRGGGGKSRERGRVAKGESGREQQRICVFTIELEVV